MRYYFYTALLVVCFAAGYSFPAVFFALKPGKPVLEVNLKDLVTKEDLLSTQISLKRDIDDLCRDMDTRFIQLEQRLIIKLGALMAFSIGIVAALVKLL